MSPDGDIRSVGNASLEPSAVVGAQPLPAVGARLRLLRRVRGVKQEYLAEIVGVSQATISRWESGWVEPPPHLALRALGAMTPAIPSDNALRRLIESSSLAVHLVTDADHRLLAASPAQEAEWGVSATEFIGQSLWPFATDEVVEAEAALAGLGWWDAPVPKPVQFVTGAGAFSGLRIVARTIVWERVWLSDGTLARLCTSVMS